MIVVVTLYRRYRYSRRVLEHLAACDGVERFDVLVHVDPGFPAVEDLARTFPLPRKEVVVNPHRLGCNGNVYAALAHGFQRDEYVVAVEDDVVPARDALRFFEWVDQPRYRDDPACFGGCAYHRELPPTPAEYNQVVRHGWFTPWGWSTWRRWWPRMQAAWPADRDPSWDVRVNEMRAANGDAYVLHPRLARTQNVGAEMGEHVDPRLHAARQFNPNWAGDRDDVPADDFREAPESPTEGPTP